MIIYLGPFLNLGLGQESAALNPKGDFPTDETSSEKELIEVNSDDDDPKKKPGSFIDPQSNRVACVVT